MEGGKELKIREYDELDAQEILELNKGSLGWSLTPEKAEKIRKLDPHVPDYFALFSVERGTVVSQVGAATVNTETISGTERLGFVWGVCTDPKAARKGYAGSLFEELHDRLSDDDIRYVLLGTSRGFVAYNLYKKLGYMDFIGLKWAIRQCKPMEKVTRDIAFTKTRKDSIFSEIWTRYTKGLLGFSKRPRDLIKIKKAWGWPPINIAGIFQRKGKTLGYILANKVGKTITIEEIIAFKQKDFRDMLKVLEMKYKPRYMLYNLLEGSHGEKIYDNLGFTRTIDTWGTLMVKDIKNRKSIKDVHKMYGIGETKFFMTAMDMY
ncbi:MAG: hypothetical protein AMK69_25305 [Nitrospira bacterium SG8_3]|nr:MAG: hypothetical protein AMK69_25305 [Nitrospira bacterium SG8_3]